MLRLVLPLAVLAAVIGIADASAKDGVHARLLQPVARDAEPGSKVRIAWTLEDARGRPFGASGIFVRVVGERGSPVEAEVEGTGRFAAEVVVPAGGIEDIQFGLRGMRRTGMDGPWEAADVVFPVRGRVFAAGSPQGGAWLLLGLIATAVAGILRVIRRRPAGASTG